MAETIPKQITAEDLAKAQREISISEFFVKNKHLLGFDNPRKALLTTIKEGVDNALDATEESRILPEIYVEVSPLPDSDSRFKVIIEDNGPGIVKEQIPRIFAKLLYGSKFHHLRQSLTSDEPILIRYNGKIDILPIGEFIDQFIAGEGEVTFSNLEVPCFDWKEYKYVFKPASSLIKHKRRNEVYRISTVYGKSIKVTGCHSVFTINKETLKVEEIQARYLKPGNIILAPQKIDIEEEKSEINILDYLGQEPTKKHFWYLYTNKEIVSDIFSRAKIVHYKKRGDKSRKYYRFIMRGDDVDIVDESYKQYVQKGFVPVWLAKSLGIKPERGVIKTYFHGKQYSTPLIWPLTSEFMKFLGLFVAEGHTDKRQIGFTFSRAERDLVNLVCNIGYSLGVNYTIEERPGKNCVRVKFFGDILSSLMRTWCGQGAKNKKIPSFVFTAPKELRQDFLDYLYRGDGHNTAKRNQLMLTTVSRGLANQVIYLWLMQGIIAANTERMNQGLGKKPSKGYIITVYGDDINKSNYFSANRKTKRRKHDLNLMLISKLFGIHLSYEVLSYLQKLKSSESLKECSREEIKKLFESKKIGYKIRFMLDENYIDKLSNGNYRLTQKTVQLSERLEKLQTLLNSDLSFLPVKEIEIINKGHEFVYDISVPGTENFVGGFGALACHNSRGQQGLGISAAVMYAQLTTGKPAKITAKTSPKKPAHYYELHLDTQKNEPEIVVDREIAWEKEHGVKVELELEAKYQKGQQSIDEYLKQTAIVNPHLHLSYKNPEGELIDFPRGIQQHPKEPKEIKPHPYGIELGILIKMLKESSARNISSFLQNEFSRISPNTAKEICEKATLDPSARPERIAREEADALYKAINATKIMAPPTDCLSPITAEAIEKGLKKEVNAEFYAAITRPPAVYRGFPFQVECAIAFGGSLQQDDLVRLLRFANRVPLQYEQSACAITKSVIQTAWKNYNLSQSRGALPIGPAVIMVHIASVWVPFTSESKEAIASYPEIIHEIKLGLQEIGRKLGVYIRKNVRAKEQKERANLFERYIPELASSLSNLSGEKKEIILENLEKKLKKELPLLLGQAQQITEGKKEEGKPIEKKEEKKIQAKRLGDYDGEE